MNILIVLGVIVLILGLFAVVVIAGTRPRSGSRDGGDSSGEADSGSSHHGSDDGAAGGGGGDSGGDGGGGD